MCLFTGFIAWGSLALSRELKRQPVAESKLYRLAHTDALTGLDNRGTFDTVLAKEAQRASRSGRPLSVLFVDVDHFKAFNDYYGHPAGDDVLRRVAQTASRCLRRDSDHVARYGGEEFVVTLPDTDAQGALTVAEGIRRAIAALDIEHAKSPYGRVGEHRRGDHHRRPRERRDAAAARPTRRFTARSPAAATACWRRSRAPPAHDIAVTWREVASAGRAG